MPHCNRALLRARREVRAQPLLLRRAGVHRHVVVDHDDVPLAQIVAVVALRRVTRRCAEVAEVPGGTRRVVLVVADRRPGAGFVSPPGGVVAGRVIGRRAILVGVVAQREHGAGNAVEQGGGRFVAARRARRDVARSDQGHRAAAGDGDGRGPALPLARRRDRGRARRQGRHQAAAAHGGHGGVGARPRDRPPGEKVAAGVPQRRGELERLSCRHAGRGRTHGDGGHGGVGHRDGRGLRDGGSTDRGRDGFRSRHGRAQGPGRHARRVGWAGGLRDSVPASRGGEHRGRPADRIAVGVLGGHRDGRRPAPRRDRRRRGGHRGLRGRHGTGRDRHRGRLRDRDPIDRCRDGLCSRRGRAEGPGRHARRVRRAPRLC